MAFWGLPIGDYRHETKQDIPVILPAAALKLEQYQLLYNDEAGQSSGNHFLRTDPPQDIDATIARIRALRPAGQCLQAEIATTAKDPFAAQNPAQNTQTDGQTLPGQQKDNLYSSQEEKDLLAALQKKLSREA